MQCQGKSFYDFLDDGSVRYSAASLRHLACEQRSEEESQAAQQAAENAAEEQKQARDGPESEVHEQQSAEQQQAQHAQQQQQQKVKDHATQGCSAYRNDSQLDLWPSSSPGFRQASIARVTPCPMPNCFVIL